MRLHNTQKGLKWAFKPYMHKIQAKKKKNQNYYWGKKKTVSRHQNTQDKVTKSSIFHHLSLFTRVYSPTFQQPYPRDVYWFAPSTN